MSKEYAGPAGIRQMRLDLGLCGRCGDDPIKAADADYICEGSVGGLNCPHALGNDRGDKEHTTAIAPS